MKASLLILALLFTACGNIKETTSTANDTFQRTSNLPQGRVTQAGIDGTSWKTGCVVNVAKRLIYSIDLTFQKDLLISRTVNYADETCASPTFEDERVTRIAITTDSTDATKTTMTETFLTQKYRALTAIANASLNEKSYCGVSTWIQNQYRVFAASADCGVDQVALSKLEIYGDQELHLDSCKTTDTDCKVITFQKNASGI